MSLARRSRFLSALLVSLCAFPQHARSASSEPERSAWSAALDSVVHQLRMPWLLVERRAPRPAPVSAAPAAREIDPDAPPIAVAELVARMVGEARARADGPQSGARPASLAALRAGALSALAEVEVAERIARQIERLLTVSPYVTRRELRARGMELSDEALASIRSDAMAARDAWLEIIERLLRDPQLEGALLNRMGEIRFLSAKQTLEVRFAEPGSAR